MHVQMEKTAGILTIGNEILSGKVTDDNSPYLCRELRSLGVAVKQLTVVPDDEEAIAEQIRSWRGQHHFLITCGGIGPTPDDVTIAGIARGLGRGVTRNAELLALIQDLYPPPHNRAMLRMADVPEGAELLHSEGLRYPVVIISNIYILPGMPEILRKKFSAIKERFRSSPFFLKKIFVNSPEVEFALHLSELLTLYPDIALGSYPVFSPAFSPVFSPPEYQVMLTLESKDPSYLEQAFQHLISLLPREVIVKTEEGEAALP